MQTLFVQFCPEGQPQSWQQFACVSPGELQTPSPQESWTCWQVSLEHVCPEGQPQSLQHVVWFSPDSQAELPQQPEMLWTMQAPFRQVFILHVPALPVQPVTFTLSGWWAHW